MQKIKYTRIISTIMSKVMNIYERHIFSRPWCAVTSGIGAPVNGKIYNAIDPCIKEAIKYRITAEFFY